ncbi:MAG: ferrous iron transport protein B [Bacillota bacterium]
MKNSGTGQEPTDKQTTPLVVMVGNPNVGKSAIFNRLTGACTAVSNYPGTTVDLTRGRMRFPGASCTIIDTPGIYSMNPVTEEEFVTRRLLFKSRPRLVIHVVDARNLERMLHLTLQLLEAGLPLLVVVNMVDEAGASGMSIECSRISRGLQAPVLPTAASTGRGIGALKIAIRDRLLRDFTPRQPLLIRYPARLEEAIRRLEPKFKASYPVARRCLALLLLEGDEEGIDLVRRCEGRSWPGIKKVLSEIPKNCREQAAFDAALARNLFIRDLCRSAIRISANDKTVTPAARLGDLMMHPRWGWPFLLAALYFGLYQFVGRFGAGTLVHLLEHKLFLDRLNPWFEQTAAAHIPWPAVNQLLAGEYGVFTLGFRYAIAITLPIVGTFFFAFALLEDTGYLPRLAYLVHNFFRKAGLSGRAVIPITLGLGCGTMATIVTRTLETRRERLIATFLLALAVPCSAQLGLILSLLASRPAALICWSVFISVVFTLSGYLADRILPGQKPVFYMEIPPLRLPRLSNIFAKTLARMQWYFLEVLPMFILASVLLWLGNITHLFASALHLLIPLVRWIGLPDRTAPVFLFGFFRRDFGAAGLYDMAASLTDRQLMVAAVVLTLFVPCMAQFAVMLKERGPVAATAIAGLVFTFAFLCGRLIHVFFLWGGWG